MNLDKIILEGETLFNKGDYDGAEKIFREILETSENSRAANNLGVIYFQKNRLAEANDFFQKSLVFDPENKDALENLKLLDEELPDTASPLPESIFDSNPESRLSAMRQLFDQQKKEGNTEHSVLTLNRAVKTSKFLNLELVSLLLAEYQQQQDINSIKKILKLTAYAQLEQNNLGNFLDLLYRSIYAENYFSYSPNYKFTKIDEDISTVVKLAARRHPFWNWSEKNPVSPPGNRKLKLGIVIEGMAAKSASIQYYVPLTEFAGDNNFEVIIFSRWSSDSEVAKKGQHEIRKKEFEQNGCKVLKPDTAQNEAGQVDFLISAITNEKPDILLFQTVFFVPVHNFIACLHLAPLQAQIEHQQPEFSRETDLVFTTKKQMLESSAEVHPYVLINHKKKKQTPVSRSQLGLVDKNIILISANRSIRYQQSEFWRSVVALLERHPETVFIPMGLEQVPDKSLLPEKFTSRVKLVGYQTNVMEHLKIADIYVDIFPSGGGSSILEAVSAGLPILSYAEDYLSLFEINNETLSGQYVQNKKLLIPKGNEEAWHSLADKLIKNKDFRNQISGELLERSKEFEPKNAAEIFYSALKSRFYSRYPQDSRNAPASKPATGYRIISSEAQNSVSDISRGLGKITVMNPTEQELITIIKSGSPIYLIESGTYPMVLSNTTVTNTLVWHLSGEEIFSDHLMNNVKGERFKAVTFASHHLKTLANQLWPETFGPVKRQFVTKYLIEKPEKIISTSGPGHNLCFTDMINQNTATDLLIQCLLKLFEKDSGYQVYMPKDGGDFRFTSYFERIMKHADRWKNIHFYSMADFNDKLLPAMNILMSFKLNTGTPYPIYHGMNHGIKPVVHQSPGATEMLPEENLFVTVNDFVDLVCESNYTPEVYRQFSANFGQPAGLKELERFLEESA